MSMAKWINRAIIPAYGIFRMKPSEFEELTIREFNQMVNAYRKVKLGMLWEQAYWVSNLMSIHTKRPVQAETLMKVFLKKKTAEQIADERTQFFEEFDKQRKEESHE